MPIAESPSRKAIHFDLITAELKKVYKSNNPFVYLQAYKQINHFFKQHGFEHRQWSGYLSKEPMLNISISKLIIKLNDDIPWLKNCVRKFDVTNVGETFDLTNIFKDSNNDENSKLPENSKPSECIEKNNPQKINTIFTRNDLKKSAAKISKESRNISQPAHHKNDREL